MSHIRPVADATTDVLTWAYLDVQAPGDVGHHTWLGDDTLTAPVERCGGRQQASEVDAHLRRQCGIGCLGAQHIDATGERLADDFQAALAAQL